MASAVAVSPVEASATNILSQKLLTEKDKMTNIEIDKRIIHIFFQELLGGKDKSGTNILPQKLLTFKKMAFQDYLDYPDACIAHISPLCAPLQTNFPLQTLPPPLILQKARICNI